MSVLRCALIGEGASDDPLVPLVAKLLALPSVGLAPDVDAFVQFVGPKETRGAQGLAARIQATVRAFPADLLFVHHDADAPTRDASVRRIENALVTAAQAVTLPPVVSVVPIREMEAWLLADESAIRRAAGKPKGRVNLGLPGLHEIESCMDPKDAVRQALRTASELPRRRWPQVDSIRRRVIAEWMDDLSPLRQLPAFQAFEADVQRVIDEQGWPGSLPDQP